MVPASGGEEAASLGLIGKSGNLVVQRSPLWLPDHSIASSYPRLIRTYRALKGRKSHASSEVCSSVSTGEHPL